MEKCEMCLGTGLILVEKVPKDSVNVYGCEKVLVYTEPCPLCRGAEDRRLFAVKQRANIPSICVDAMMDDFKWDIYRDAQNNVVDLTKQKEFVDSFIDKFSDWEKQGLGLYIYSRLRGTGKTYLASCICNTLMKKHQIVTKFVSVSDLINLAKNAKPNEKDPIDILCECRLLVLDDIGQKTTGEEWMNDLLFKIIEARYQHKRVTMFTSNIKNNELRMDDRIISRIDKISCLVPLPEYSYRSKEAYDEKKDFFKEMGLM